MIKAWKMNYEDKRTMFTCLTGNCVKGKLILRHFNFFVPSGTRNQSRAANRRLEELAMVYGE